MKNDKLRRKFFVKIIFKPLKMVKSGPIFDQAAKLGKVSRDAYDSGLWLILQDLLKNWVAEGVASNVNVQVRLRKQIETHQLS